MPPVLFVTGGPGAGKGTQCALITDYFGADVRGEDGNDAPSTSDSTVVAPKPSRSPSRTFGIAHISVGAVLRRAGSMSDALSASDRDLVLSTLSVGGILPGRLTVELLRLECARLVSAQHAADATVRLAFIIDGFPRTMDNVVEFERQCGAVTSVLLIDCDEESMRQRLAARRRADDLPHIIQRRIEGYNAQTKPVVEWFEKKVKESSESTASSSSRASSASLASSSSTSSADDVGVAPLLFVVDGRPAIDTVWKDVRRAFGEFVRARMDVDIDATPDEASKDADAATHARNTAATTHIVG